MEQLSSELLREILLEESHNPLSWKERTISNQMLSDKQGKGKMPTAAKTSKGKHISFVYRYSKDRHASS